MPPSETATGVFAVFLSNVFLLLAVFVVLLLILIALCSICFVVIRKFLLPIPEEPEESIELPGFSGVSVQQAHRSADTTLSAVDRSGFRSAHEKNRKYRSDENISQSAVRPRSLSSTSF